MNHDGTKQGFALDITGQLAHELPVPVIASGGGGTMHILLMYLKRLTLMQPWRQVSSTLKRYLFRI